MKEFMDLSFICICKEIVFTIDSIDYENCQYLLEESFYSVSKISFGEGNLN